MTEATTTNVEIPVIETERLTLGPLTLADVDAFARFVATERSRPLGGPDDDPQGAWWSIATHAGQWTLRGYGGLAMRDRASGGPAGRVSLWHPGWFDEPELSWVVFDGFEGRGLAFEAAVALRDWAWRARGLGPLVSLIAEDNSRSIRLAERLGCVREGDHVYNSGKTVGRWRHPSPGAEAA